MKTFGHIAILTLFTVLGVICPSCLSSKDSAQRAPEIISKDGAKLYQFNVGPSRFLMNPEEGALLMSWHVKRTDGLERSVIYWPENGPVRGDITTVYGGAPIFFPFAGISFADGKPNMWKTPTGQVCPMRKFGFTDNGRFEIVSVSPSDIVLKFIHSDYSKKAYPFDFDLFVHYRFFPKSYVLELKFENKSDIALPWGAGHHPFVTMPWNKGETHGDYRMLLDCGGAYYIDNAEGVLHRVEELGEKCFGDKAMTGRIHSDLKSGIVKVGPKHGREDLTIIINDGKVGPTFVLVNWGKPGETPFWAVEPWMVPPLAAGRNAPTIPAHSEGFFKVEVKL